ncbi:MAG TPA: TlpA disulfide reductase family protein [Chitinophagales bacterium]
MKILFLLLSFALLLPANEKVTAINLQQLQNKVQQQSDTLYVVNFWATWCRPCVKEMPYFEEANKQFAAQKVKVIFVSLDAPKDLVRVNKFMVEKNISAETFLLDAGNPNVWIDQIEPKWSGSIPATILYKNGKKVGFFEHDFEQQSLDSLIKTNIK